MHNRIDAMKSQGLLQPPLAHPETAPRLFRRLGENLHTTRVYVRLD
jgi:hypothetical protein